MKQRISLFGLLVLLFVAVACNPGSVNNALDTACDLSGCISLSKFSANIDSQLENNVVGYVSTVGALAIISKDGMARTAADSPSRTMDTDIPTNIASLSKVLTTIAVLRSLAKHNLTIDSKISPYLPPDWSQGSNISTISFRDLLTHSAGFRVNGNGANTTYAVLKQQITNGVLLSDKAVPQYNNLNFAIFRELLPFMEGFNDPGPANRPIATATFYIDYMRQQVFEPLGISGTDCKPAANSHPVLSYPPPPIGATNGLDWGDWTAACGGGGWVLTAGDLYKVMLDLSSGTTLLSNSQKAQMNATCLGWDCSVLSQTNFVGKNGILNNGTIWLWTFFGVFKCTVPVVVVVNSNTPMNVTSVVATAFSNATVPPPGTLQDPCPVGAKSFQQLQFPAQAIPVDTVEFPLPVLVQAQPVPVQQPTATNTLVPLPQISLIPLLPLATLTRTPTPREIQALPPPPTATRTHTPIPRDAQGPSAPVLVSPIDGANVQCTQVTLLWRPSTDPSGVRDYDVELEKLVGRNYVAERSWNSVRGTSVSFTPSCNTTFRWRVRATDNVNNEGNWAGYEIFHVGETPPR